MKSDPSNATEWRAEYDAGMAALKDGLTALQFDGPKVLGGDMFSASGAVCLRCGALVMLGDPEDRSGGATTERGIRLHAEWHKETSA